MPDEVSALRSFDFDSLFNFDSLSNFDRMTGLSISQSLCISCLWDSAGESTDKTRRVLCSCTGVHMCTEQTIKRSVNLVSFHVL